MDQEQSWINVKTVGEDDNAAATNYEYFMRPEPRENLGPVRLEYDGIFGRRVKVRDVRIGMTRNAADENKKSIKAYLEPYPHTRINTAKPLQGWYKALHEPDGVRARPCFTEAILTEPYGGFCAVGCAFCLTEGHLVETPRGTVPIENIVEGDRVLGRTYVGVQETEVLAVCRRSVTETILLTLSTGRTIRCTSDHPIWSETRKAWVDAGNLRKGESLQAMRKTGEESEENLLFQRVLAGGQPTASKTPNQTVSLRRTDSETADDVRCLRFAGSVSKRSKSQGAFQRLKGDSQISGNPTEDAGTCIEESGKYVGTCSGTKICRVQTRKGRRCKKRNFRISLVKAGTVCLSEGSDVFDAVRVGTVNSRLVRQEGIPLGVRTRSNSNNDRGLSSRLSVSERSTDRSQGVFFGTGPQEARRGSQVRPSGGVIRPETFGDPRHPTVQEIRRIQEVVQVYDIQTTTENFYVEGVLVHNCYVNSGFRGYRGTGLITVPVNYGEQIRDQLKKVRRGAAGYFSSFTDPFLPLEEVYHNTERAAEEFVNVGLPIFFLSRLKYPEWAIELMKQNPHSYAQKSINTCDPDDWRYLSPGALPLEEHFEDIARLRKAGIYVSIQCNPVVAGVTSNEQIVKLFKRLAEAGANHVIVKFVEAGYSWAPAMVERMIKRFGDRGREFEKLFTENIGGQRTIQETYRLNAHKLYAAYARKFGLTYATCYEYRYEKDAAGNLLGKTGVSIGREFTTASQCHGQAVPVYSRASEADRFEPLDECPPSGCLYCASENGGKPRCGDDLAGEAKALKLVDLKVPLR